MLAPAPDPRALLEPARIPLALYVHFPWCVQKCPYCDFNSHRLEAELDEDRYLDALLADLEFELRDRPLRPLRSVFLGGGTPSLFSARAVGRLLARVAACLPLSADAEITIEANPGSADAENFRGYRRAGVNRLSLGVQSWDDAMLRALGRIHDGAQAAHAVALARAAGFENLNLDLMYGLPQQSPEAARADLARTLEAAPEHVSWYHLTLEPHTAFHRAPPALPSADAVAEIEEAGRLELEAAGYAQYEVSAYARPGRRSRHNLNYWGFGDYLAIGAGAHGKWSDGGGGVLRRVREPHPRRYLGSAGTAAVLRESRAVPTAELPFEYALNTLRLREGFLLGEFEQRTGLARACLDPVLARTGARGLTEVAGERVRCTERGFAFLNDTVEAFLP